MAEAADRQEPLPRPGLACAPNFRDLGGLRAAGGARVAHGRVFRSEALPVIDAADAAALRAHDVRLVCDLRGARERAAAPNAWWREAGVELLELDITADIRGTAHWDALRDDPGEAGAVAMMRLTYRALPAAAAPHMRRLFDRIDAGQLPVLIHCTAGKDRTGAVVALLLSALGVPREVILQDYLESATRLNAVVVEATRALVLAGLGAPAGDAALHAITGVRAVYLDDFFGVVEADYRSVEQYLRDETGLDAAKRERLRARLLE